MFLDKLNPGERLSLILFGVVWLASVVAGFALLSKPAPQWVYVNALGGEGYPTVQGYTKPSAEALTNLRVGDRIVAVGDRDLEGRGQLGFFITLSDVAFRTDGPVPLTVERNGVRQEVMESQPDEFPTKVFTELIVQVVWGLTCILILLRAPPSRETRAIFLGFAFYTLAFTQLVGGPAWAQAFYLALYVPVAIFSAVFFAFAYVAFPPEARSLYGWNLKWPWLFIGAGIPAFSLKFGMPIPPPTARWLSATPFVALILAILATLTVNYRRCGPVGRRKVKWIILAVYIGALQGLVQVWLLGPTPPDPPTWSLMSNMAANLLFPLALLIAMSRFDLFDIDRLIGAAVAYNILGVVVMGAGFAFLPSMTEVLTGAMGMDPTLGRSAVALGLAAVVVVGQRQYGHHVNRVFFKERFALEEAMKHLPEKLGAARDTPQLWHMTGSELMEHLRPSTCVIFASAGDSFIPVYADGDLPSLAVPAEEDFIGWMESLPAATHVERRMTKSAGPVGSAVLASLEPAVLLSVRRSGSLEAFISLGEKRSGDIYTNTDVSLLAALSQSLSIHLLRFSETELLERSREMQEKMRRYVPGALAEEIASGRELETGEREISVLFVDIRGYTEYADGLETPDIFSTVNRYTETVSSIVDECGGAVVEFNGDGMMAVFGAPRFLDDKEGAALRAAQRMVEEVPAVHVSESDTPLEVGVGVATGPAYVGNIRAVDRIIWSALGSTTNLAARLQVLTRELGASILVDGLTGERAGAESLGFIKHTALEVRGRRDLQTVFARGRTGAGAE